MFRDVFFFGILRLRTGALEAATCTAEPRSEILVLLLPLDDDISGIERPG